MNALSRERQPAPVAVPPEAVVIGASAGAVEALSVLLPALPGDFPLPVLTVVHLPSDRKSLLASVLKSKCQMDVREVEDKEPMESGTVYFAPPDYHLLVEADLRLSLSSEAPVLFSRPSIDVLFESAADIFGPALIGVILTGANCDGSRGLRAVTDAGGVALVQRPDQAQAKTMPQAALEACHTARSLSIPEIAVFLQEAVTRK
ncbi:chemotaxis protein CheB [Schlesneria paludicola]|uniref:chemotaxis protein CheB n=1 Tax=Schlesneria paludicola TaxID=360056 RepID=UPI00029AEC29|nr:chemotaxis protein CheB [Schlesneria paludicola]